MDVRAYEQALARASLRTPWEMWSTRASDSRDAVRSWFDAGGFPLPLTRVDAGAGDRTGAGEKTAGGEPSGDRAGQGGAEADELSEKGRQVLADIISGAWKRAGLGTAGAAWAAGAAGTGGAGEDADADTKLGMDARLGAGVAAGTAGWPGPQARSSLEPIEAPGAARILALLGASGLGLAGSQAMAATKEQANAIAEFNANTQTPSKGLAVPPGAPVLAPAGADDRTAAGPSARPLVLIQADDDASLSLARQYALFAATHPDQALPARDRRLGWLPAGCKGAVFVCARLAPVPGDDPCDLQRLLLDSLAGLDPALPLPAGVPVDGLTSAADDFLLVLDTAFAGPLQVEGVRRVLEAAGLRPRATLAICATLRGPSFQRMVRAFGAAPTAMWRVDDPRTSSQLNHLVHAWVGLFARDGSVTEELLSSGLAHTLRVLGYPPLPGLGEASDQAGAKAEEGRGEPAGDDGAFGAPDTSTMLLSLSLAHDGVKTRAAEDLVEQMLRNGASTGGREAVFSTVHDMVDALADSSGLDVANQVDELAFSQLALGDADPQALETAAVEPILASCVAQGSEGRVLRVVKTLVPLLVCDILGREEPWEVVVALRPRLSLDTWVSLVTEAAAAASAKRYLAAAWRIVDGAYFALTDDKEEERQARRSIVRASMGLGGLVDPRRLKIPKAWRDFFLNGHTTGAQASIITQAKEAGLLSPGSIRTLRLCAMHDVYEDAGREDGATEGPDDASDHVASAGWMGVLAAEDAGEALRTMGDLLGEPGRERAWEDPGALVAMVMLNDLLWASDVGVLLPYPVSVVNLLRSDVVHRTLGAAFDGVEAGAPMCEPSELVERLALSCPDQLPRIRLASMARAVATRIAQVAEGGENADQAPWSRADECALAACLVAGLHQGLLDQVPELRQAAALVASQAHGQAAALVAQVALGDAASLALADCELADIDPAGLSSTQRSRLTWVSAELNRW